MAKGSVCPACDRRHKKSVDKCIAAQLEKASKAAMHARDEGQCQWCGRIDGKLDWHHVRPRSACQRLKYDLDNFLTLCFQCHIKWHEDTLTAARWFADKWPDRVEYLDAMYVANKSKGTFTRVEKLEVLAELREYVDES